MPQPYQIQFNNHLVEFIKQLQVCIPSEKKLFAKYYKYYRKHIDEDRRCDFIGEFVKCISKYNKEVSTCDEGLFSEENEYYPNKPIQLMKGIDFKKIWRLDDLSDESKASIWKHLQTLYLIGTFVLKEAHKYDEMLQQQQDIIYNLLQNIKYEKQIKADAKQDEQTAQSNADGFNLDGFLEIFDENNIMTKLIHEIIKEIKFDKLDIGTIMSFIRSLLGQGGLTSQNIISNLHKSFPNMEKQLCSLFGQENSTPQEVIANLQEKLGNILKDSGLTEAEIAAQAEQTRDRLLHKLNNTAGMASIFGNLFKPTTKYNSTGKPDKDQMTQEQLNKCQNINHELLESLKQSFQAIGGVDAELLQKNIENIMTQVYNNEYNIK